MDTTPAFAQSPDSDDFKIKGKGKQKRSLLASEGELSSRNGRDSHHGPDRRNSLDVQDVQDARDGGRDAPQDTCVICLERISERAVVVPCNHLNFDFLCLVSWLQEQPSCPLCKAQVTQVQYDWRSPQDYKTYIIPAEKDEPAARAASAPVTGPLTSRRPQFQRTFRRGNGRFNPPPRQATPDSALAFRRRIYAAKSFSLHVGANRVSEYRNFTPATFAANSRLQTRARTFMRRELQVFSFLQHPNLEFLIEYIVALLKKLDIKGADGAAKELVAEFLGVENAALFLHELEQWLRSPYEKLDDWDRHVQYAPPSANEARSSTSN